MKEEISKIYEKHPEVFDLAIMKLDPDYRKVMFAVKSQFYNDMEAWKRNLGPGSYYGFVRTSAIQKQLKNHLSKWQVSRRLNILHEWGFLKRHERKGHLSKISHGWRPTVMRRYKIDNINPQNLIIE